MPRARAGRRAALTGAALFLAAGLATALAPDEPIVCGACAHWNAPQDPVHIYGNTYDVGVAGLSVILIRGQQGSILIDGALPQSVPLILEHLARLGVRAASVRVILNSHTHFDHAGGIAALQRATGAEVRASAASARALESGGPTPDDPQYASPDNHFAPVMHVHVIADGETVQVGGVGVTAHFTPGHTPGSTSWTWRSCEGTHCLDMVYADSLSAVSAQGFRFTAGGPERLEAFNHSIDLVGALPCDVLLSPHPENFDLEGKLEARRQHPDRNPFIDATACKRYADEARRRLRARVAAELGGRAPAT
ncbi:MAG TPA: subclass B3 metallo-beta-lactamase [Steroidobacteraceae bacterium]|nr:subclass B3 metallo-beta-lactamase [Steroidobacteraceae bacterium]